jgi:hypothetical protein
MNAHPALATEEDFDKFFAAVEAGETLTKAAKKVNWSLNQLKYRIDKDPELLERLVEARRIGAQANEDDGRALIRRRAHEDDASAQMVGHYLTIVVPGFRDAKVAPASQPAMLAKTENEGGMPVNLDNVLAIMAEAGLRAHLTIEPAEADGSSTALPGPGLLPAPSD